MSAPRTLTEARPAFVLAMLRRNAPFGRFALTEGKEYCHEFGLTLRHNDDAIDRLVVAGRAQLHIGAEGVWVELAGAQP